ncbi:MAG: type II toxin-antitoxin system RelB/DinJ family antitoxin [Thiohalomonadales bacterium]
MLTALDLNFSEVVNIFTCVVVSKRGLPFDVTLPNEETAAAMLDVRASKNKHKN